MLGMFSAFAQIQVPAEEPIVIELTGGELLYGFTDSDVLDSGRATGIQVKLDAPWLREPERQKLLPLDRVQGHQPERPAARKRRYLENEYVLVKGPTGMLAVEKSEYDYAQRSNELASALARERRDTGAAGSPSTRDTNSATVNLEAPGFMEQWKGHFIVTGICAALGLVVVRGLLLR